ncbi:FIG043197: Inositol monophosphatase family protein [hydrothermal vent metagenome]|uniref:FIG043197: Inositol monophosphatase family protein n=1 Tax=hydrothermal vent metagenome TaxID=652676 RepID=A0A3B0T348_9ZZZZ
MPVSKVRSDDEKLLDQAVREAGALALQFYNSSAKSWDKSDGSPVTEADLAVDAFLKDALMKDRPDYGWLSEETTDNEDRLSCQKVWIVDPIDGTRSFVERTGEWCISAALVENGKPVLAKIFHPLANECYSAVPGGGAMRNGEPIKTTKRDTLENCRLMTRGRVLDPAKWEKPWPHMQTGIATSLALRLCMVADGRFDGTIALGNKCDWDLAAGDLIVREAGGCISNIHGDKLVYNGKNTRQPGGLIAAGKPLFNIMLEQAKTLKNR